MKVRMLLPALLLVCALNANAESPKIFNGSFEMVVCANQPALEVHDSDLQRVLFSVPNYSPTKVFQGWGEHKRTKQINGASITFVKVQFPGQDENVGWVAENLVRARSLCQGAARKDSLERAQVTEISSGVRGLNDPACCFFPVKGEPTADFNTAQRRFGARRSGGARLHAACDLYRYINEPIYSVAPGTVLRDPYLFYQGTYALEVRHSGGFVVRYGEITARRVSGVSAGREVNTSQMLGYIGKVGSNCCEPMLHFELYSGARNGSLNVGGNKYLRRPDLMDPTAYLKRWEANTLRHRR